MRRTGQFGLASTGAIAGLVLIHSLGVTRADDPKVKGAAHSVKTTIVQTYVKEQILEVKVNRILEVSQSDEKKTDAAKTESVVRVGQVIFVDAALCPRVVDDKGVEKKRDDKTAWFSKDDGWAFIKTGQRVKLDFRGSREIPAPKGFPEGVCVGERLVVYTPTLIELLPDDGADYGITVESGVAEGAIARLCEDERLIELKVEVKAESAQPASKDAPVAGKLVLFRVEQATLIDDKGIERKRDDKSAWFSKADGWSILKLRAGDRVKIAYSSTQKIPAPTAAELSKDSRVGGTVLVYNASIIYLLSEAK